MEDTRSEDPHEIAANSVFLTAVGAPTISTELFDKLAPYADLRELELRLEGESALTFERIFNSATGFYLLKCFLLADYAVDKAIFIKDVRAYKKMRFLSARRKVAKLMYQRFVAQENENGETFPPGSSVFEIFEQRRETSSTLPKPTEKSNGGAATSGDKEGEEASHETASLLAANMPNQNTLAQSVLQIGADNNSIGVYGKSVRAVRRQVMAGNAPISLFDEVMVDVTNDLRLDIFPRFRKSDFFQQYIRTKSIESVAVNRGDFTSFRVLGRGGFGAVHACRKNDSGVIYAIKCINKKLVSVKSALENVLEERNVLSVLKSPFVTNLKYALQDDDELHLVMDLMLGGDLKFHLINAGRFTERQARFYAAEVLLGLEHVHENGIIYRDMKLENVLLDREGHCRISDLGLAAVTKVKIKGYAGTPGYTAPEMVKNKLYGPAADLFSFGVLIFRMLCGSKPFRGKVDRDLDRSVVDMRPQFPKDFFSPEATDLLTGMLQKKPERRLGSSARGLADIKEHQFFESIDWGLLEAGYLDPPFVPNRFDVNAPSLKDVGEFDTTKYRHVKLDDAFIERLANFDFISVAALQEEMCQVLGKIDENTSFDKYSAELRAAASQRKQVPVDSPCCAIS